MANVLLVALLLGLALLGYWIMGGLDRFMEKNLARAKALKQRGGWTALLPWAIIGEKNRPGKGCAPDAGTANHNARHGCAG